MSDHAQNVAYKPIRQVGRYELFEEIATGGFASVHLARTLGVGGFSRTVAIKRLHAQFAKDANIVAMFLDEARIVARIRHTNVLPTIDFVEGDGELMIVMEYVEGVTLGFLLARASRLKGRLPFGVALRIVCGTLRGLHAAHEATNEQGQPLGLIHRDVTPDNVMVGADGLSRLLDFGVARAMGDFHSTRDGQVKGKLSYLSPEQVTGDPLDRRTDVYSASVVLWEALVGKRLFHIKTLGEVAEKILNPHIAPPSSLTDVPKSVDEVVLRGLAQNPDDRWQSAADMAKALERAHHMSSNSTVAQYVSRAGKRRLDLRRAQVAVMESTPLGLLLDVDPTGPHGRAALMTLMQGERDDLLEVVGDDHVEDIEPAIDSAPSDSFDTEPTDVEVPADEEHPADTFAASSRDSLIEGKLTPVTRLPRWRLFFAAAVAVLLFSGVLAVRGGTPVLLLRPPIASLSAGVQVRIANAVLGISQATAQAPPRPAAAAADDANIKEGRSGVAPAISAQPAPAAPPNGYRPSRLPTKSPRTLYGRE